MLVPSNLSTSDFMLPSTAATWASWQFFEHSRGDWTLGVLALIFLWPKIQHSPVSSQFLYSPPLKTLLKVPPVSEVYWPLSPWLLLLTALFKIANQPYTPTPHHARAKDAPHPVLHFLSVHWADSFVTYSITYFIVSIIYCLPLPLLGYKLYDGRNLCMENWCIPST